MSKLLKLGQKLYGIYGEAEIIKVDEGDSKLPYKIKLKSGVIDRWLSEDLKESKSQKHPSMYTLEDCPDCYRPKVRKYKVLFANKKNSVCLSEGYYESVEDFNMYYDFAVIELVKHLYRDE